MKSAKISAMALAVILVVTSQTRAQYGPSSPYSSSPYGNPYGYSNPNSNTATSSKPGEPAELRIDVSQPLPTTLELTVGDTLVFFHYDSYTNADVKVQFTADAGHTVDPLKVDTSASGTANSLTTLISAQALHAGTGKATVEYTAKAGPNKGKTSSMNLVYTVAPRQAGKQAKNAPKDIEVNVAGQMPAAIDLAVGQTISFVQTVDLPGSTITVSFEHDGEASKAPLEEGKAPAKEKGKKVTIATLKATREGAGAFEVKFNLATTPPTVKSEQIVFTVAGVKSKIEPLSIDLAQDLPKKITLVEGQQVTFDNDTSAKVDAKDTDSKGELLSKQSHNTLTQAAAFRAERAGQGEVTVVFPQQGLATVPRKVTVPVEVTAAADKTASTTATTPADLVVDLSKKLPKDIQLVHGQKVVFSGDKAGKVTVRINDGKGELLATRPHNKAKEAAAFEAVRPGAGEVHIELPSTGNATAVRKFALRLEVKPDPTGKLKAPVDPNEECGEGN